MILFHKIYFLSGQLNCQTLCWLFIVSSTKASISMRCSSIWDIPDLLLGRIRKRLISGRLVGISRTEQAQEVEQFKNLIKRLTHVRETRQKFMFSWLTIWFICVPLNELHIKKCVLLSLLLFLCEFLFTNKNSELRQTTHDQEVLSSNPGTVYWMDVSDASYYIQKPMKINENKGSQMGHTKKIFKKKN